MEFWCLSGSSIYYPKIDLAIEKMRILFLVYKESKGYCKPLQIAFIQFHEGLVLFLHQGVFLCQFAVTSAVGGIDDGT